MPLKKHTEITYRVKCVTVENERVFGDVYITQMQDLIYRTESYPFPSECRKQKRNLIQQTLDGPNFMELNSKRSTGSAGVKSSRWQKRSKLMGDEPNIIAHNYKDAENHDAVIKRPKVKCSYNKTRDFIDVHQENFLVNDVKRYNPMKSTCFI